jgi:sugar lactone lactonase YvrE
MGGSVQGTPLSLTGTVATVVSGQSFDGPISVTTDGAGNLYVADSNSHRILKVVIATGAVSTLAGSGVPQLLDGTGTGASFNTPGGITIDNGGQNLYVADSLNFAIRRIVIATGVVTTVAGGNPGFTDSAVGSAATFDSPQGITTDGTDLYVADSANNAIRKVELASGNFGVTTFAGGGPASPGFDNGVGIIARFNFPQGITTNGTDLFVADTVNNAIRTIRINTANVLTLAGSSGVAGNDNGAGQDATFNLPYGVASDGTSVYVADSSNNMVRKVVISTGEVTTLAGAGPGLGGFTNGTGVDATFRAPDGITTDGVRLYVADFGNNAIRSIH